MNRLISNNPEFKLENLSLQSWPCLALVCLTRFQIIMGIWWSSIGYFLLLKSSHKQPDSTLKQYWLSFGQIYTVYSHMEKHPRQLYHVNKTWTVLLCKLSNVIHAQYYTKHHYGRLTDDHLDRSTSRSFHWLLS